MTDSRKVFRLAKRMWWWWWCVVNHVQDIRKYVLRRQPLQDNVTVQEPETCKATIESLSIQALEAPNPAVGAYHSTRIQVRVSFFQSFVVPSTHFH